jgi:hypothetical protein
LTYEKTGAAAVLAETKIRGPIDAIHGTASGALLTMAPSPYFRFKERLPISGKLGEWLIEKHGNRTRRPWRKLHLGMDAGNGQMWLRHLSNPVAPVASIDRQLWCAMILENTTGGQCHG